MNDDGDLVVTFTDGSVSTSEAFGDIVAALADEFFAGSGARDAVRSIFVVGDEKQSIYSFQGADPDAFDKMSGHFRAQAEGAGQPWKPLALTRSFRAAPALLSVC